MKRDQASAVYNYTHIMDASYSNSSVHASISGSQLVIVIHCVSSVFIENIINNMNRSQSVNHPPPSSFLRLSDVTLACETQIRNEH